MHQDNDDCGSCGSGGCPGHGGGAGEQEQKDRQDLMRTLDRIKHKIIVLSGKGGVGKTTVAANLALTLAAAGKKTGILDVDVHGPSIPHILGLDGGKVEILHERLLALPVNDNLKAMSIGLLIKKGNDPVIWRGPLKMGVITQFLKDVEWGELDYLVIDCPPGTGDEPLSVIQLIENLDGAVIVTTPQELSTIDVRRSIQFCSMVKVPVLGVIENMSGFVCPHCGESTEIFKAGGGQKMAMEMNVPFMGRIPLDPKVAEAADQGEHYVTAFAESETAKAMAAALGPIVEAVESGQ